MFIAKIDVHFEKFLVAFLAIFISILYVIKLTVVKLFHILHVFILHNFISVRVKVFKLIR